MKAAILSAPHPIARRPLPLCDIPIPQPEPGKLLLKVRACGICRTDLHIVEGELPPQRPNITPGHQIVGDIVAGALFLLLIVAAGFAPAGPARALAVFLIVFCLMSSFTETGLGNASPYMLDLTVAASLLSPVLKLKRPALREAV